MKIGEVVQIGPKPQLNGRWSFRPSERIKQFTAGYQTQLTKGKFFYQPFMVNMC